MRVLVLGGYGLIGLAIVRALLARGVEVVGAGRRPELGETSEPRADWVRLDLASPTSIAALDLSAVDAVINAAGALQDGAGDSLDAVHHTGIAALIARCEADGVERFVQISAAGAAMDASTPFLRTKAAGDRALRASGLSWVILKPGLVLGRESYGGTTLLRALAALPLVQPITFADSTVDIVALDDVANQAAHFAMDASTGEVEIDLVADRPIRFDDLVTAMRARLGWGTARILPLPGFMARGVGRVGDAAAALGWKSPLRSTAMTVMSDGVTGDPQAFQTLTGSGLGPPQSVIDRLDGGARDRAYAILFWVRPALLITLATFWIATGVIALNTRDAALPVLTSAGLSAAIASVIVVGGSILDILLGLGALVRRTSALALWGMIAVTASYLFGASLVTPELWLDPLGPLVKPIPAAVMAAIALSLREAR